jgi:hypothetical protein
MPSEALAHRDFFLTATLVVYRAAAKTLPFIAQMTACLILQTSEKFGERASVFAALVLLAAWPQRWRFAAVGLTGLALALQAGHSHAFAMEHGPSLLLYGGRTARSCRRCLARRIAAAADPGPRRPIKARRRNAEALL